MDTTSKTGLIKKISYEEYKMMFDKENEILKQKHAAETNISNKKNDKISEAVQMWHKNRINRVMDSFTLIENSVIKAEKLPDLDMRFY